MLSELFYFSAMSTICIISADIHMIVYCSPFHSLSSLCTRPAVHGCPCFRIDHSHNKVKYLITISLISFQNYI